MILARQFLSRSKGTADDVGEYVAPNLIPSRYMVRVVVAGFKDRQAAKHPWVGLNLGNEMPRFQSY